MAEQALKRDRIAGTRVNPLLRCKHHTKHPVRSFAALAAASGIQLEAIATSPPSLTSGSRLSGEYRLQFCRVMWVIATKASKGNGRSIVAASGSVARVPNGLAAPMQH